MSMTTALKNKDLIQIFGKLKPQGTLIDWDLLKEKIEQKFGGMIIQPRLHKSEFSFECVDVNLIELVSFAETGDLDTLILENGHAKISEILLSGECYYQAIPQLRFKSPKFHSVTTVDLQQAINRVDVLIMTTTEVERKAVHSAMLPWPETDHLLQGALSNRVYVLGTMGGYCVAQVSSTMGSLGRQGSTITSLKAIEHVTPRAVIIIGIAFGFDRKKQRLGDVLIAESVFPYELQRVGVEFSVQRGTEIQCGLVLSNRFRELRSDWTLLGARRPVQVQQGLMLSGEKLVDNKAFRDSLKAAFPTALGGEMEGAGAYASASEAKIEMILIKAICDWADGHKDDRAQPFAAFTSVSLVKHVLSKKDVLNELGARAAGLEPVQPGEGITEPNDLNIRDPWATLMTIAPELYATGPAERNVWQRSGGDLSRINLQSDGRTAWDTALRTLEKGGGGSTLRKLITKDRLRNKVIW